MSVPTSTRRMYLPRALCGLALALYGLGITSSAIAAPTTSTADQSDTGTRESLPEVTVIGKMDKRTLNHVVNQFIESHAKASVVISQIGRWRENICPAVFGLKSSYAETVSSRITDLARKVGAPTRVAGKKCAANLDVVFTPEPQAQLDFIAKRYRSLLGYYPTRELQQATTVSHPVQAWYETGSRSLDGFQAGAPMPGAKQSSTYSPPPPGDFMNFNTGLVVDSAQSAGENGNGMGPTGSAGSHLSHGLRSEFLHVLVIVDAKKVTGYSLQTVSDYIALVALTHIASLDTCSQLPSILNLFAKDCGAPPSAMTASDIAYLKALYGADLDKNLNIEQGDIRVHMVDAISK